MVVIEIKLVTPEVQMTEWKSKKNHERDPTYKL